MKEIRILNGRCKGCGYCVAFCPVNVFEMSNEVNSRGFHTPKVKNPERCTFCGFCELICPDFAIFLVER